MEDLEQRRQRLAAMREEAALETYIVPTPSTPDLTSDPFGSSTASPSPADSNNSGFGFYTDPLAGFSKLKRRRPVLAGAPSAPDGVAVPPAALPLHSNAYRGGDLAPHFHPSKNVPPYQQSSWQPTPYQMPDAWQPTPYQMPVGWQPVPYQMPGAMSSAPAHPTGPVQFYPQPAPHFMNQKYSEGVNQRARGRTSSSFVGSGASLGSASRGRGYFSNSGGGRGYENSRIGRSPAQNAWVEGCSSRGKDEVIGGRGGPASGRQQLHLYFKKSMVEDPWQHLEAT